MIGKIIAIKKNGNEIYTKEETNEWNCSIISPSEKKIKDGNISFHTKLTK